MKVLVFNPELCTGCGVCEETCAMTYYRSCDPEKSAILISRSAKGWDASFCSQCGICIDSCPTLSLSRDRRGIVRLYSRSCVGCLACVGFCPTGAMRTHRDENTPYKCVACGICAEACPTGALEVREVADAEPTETEKRVRVVAR